MAYKIFVSHVWRAHHDYYWGLIRLLDRAKRFQFVDLSVPKLRPLDGNYAAVRADILELLRSADVVLTINTPVITNSEAVRDELNEAEALGIPIIAISIPKRRGKTKTCSFPPIMRAAKANWTSRGIVEAIRVAVRSKPRVSQTQRPEAGYEPVAGVAATVAAPQIVEVCGDDEEVASTEPATQGQLPRDVIPVVRKKIATEQPREPWLRRVLSWGRSARPLKH